MRIYSLDILYRIDKGIYLCVNPCIYLCNYLDIDEKHCGLWVPRHIGFKVQTSNNNNFDEKKTELILIFEDFCFCNTFYNNTICSILTNIINVKVCLIVCHTFTVQLHIWSSFNRHRYKERPCIPFI